ncbi:cytochrome b/b6 domain-containing protein [Inhella gelatinilytica]|uniref:Cytochrome b/b6 domain-containing protein n=1 Tax=Inhella gelatinilytica TaxID=2795030 RepID=A0A931ITY7_9BURK|nr:cytochrome b/b6 domain-containing protein [Inhella gelatinilytica]MBH9551907.1 cytochrome b/b6 domain-containing protein [Inhella gelatinilytica]
MNPTPSSLTVQPAPRVWDAPVRVLHGLSALCFAGAWLTAEVDRLRPLHISLGLCLAALMALRVLWGLVGSPTARFSHFLKGPTAVVKHFTELTQGRLQAHAGHNPAGGWAVVGLIGLSLASAATGWLTWTGGETFEDLHEGVATAALALVGLHLAAVALTSHLSQRNLVASMVHGRAEVPPSEGIPRNHTGLAALILVATVGFVAWGLAPNSPLRAPGANETAETQHHRERGQEPDDEDEDEAPRLMSGAAMPPASPASATAPRSVRHDDDD